MKKVFIKDYYTVHSGLSISREKFNNGSVPFITFSSIFNNRALSQVPNEYVEVEEKKTHMLEIGDVFLTRTSEKKNELGMSSVVMCNMENVAFNGFSKLLKQNANASSIIDPIYISYYCRCNKFREQIISMSTITTRASLNNEMISKLFFEIPSLEIQKEIANRISVYDDKIENNNKIINTLEEMASLLYKRYFVDFEFPNDEGKPYKSNGGQFIDSELGQIPMGWEINSLGSKQFPLVNTGVKEFMNTKKYIATADVSDTNIYHNYTEVNYEEKPSRANMYPVENSIWFAKMKDSRKLIRVSSNNINNYNDIILSTGFSGLNVNNVYFNYLWTFISSQKFNEIKNNLSNGTTMQAINNTNIKSINFVLPNEEVINIFNEKVESMFRMIENLQIENKTLEQIRDLLINELIK